jgi:hypothetical protein
MHLNTKHFVEIAIMIPKVSHHTLHSPVWIIIHQHYT